MFRVVPRGFAKLRNFVIACCSESAVSWWFFHSMNNSHLIHNCEFINMFSSFKVIPKHRLYVFDWVFPFISIFVCVRQFKITYLTSRMRFDLVPLCSIAIISLLQAFIYTTGIRINHSITKLSPIEISFRAIFVFLQIFTFI